MLQDYFARVLRHPWKVLLLTVGLSLAAGAGLPRLEFTTDYRVFFSEDNPDLVAFEKIESEFARSESVFFALEPKGGDVFTLDTLRAVQEMTAAGIDLPYARSVYSLSNFHEPQAEGDEIGAKPLMPEVPLEDLDLKAFRATALANERLVRGLLSVNGDVTGVIVYINLPQTQEENDLAWVARESQQLADRIEAAYPDIKVHLAGIVMFNSAMRNAISADLQTLYPLTALIMFGLLGVYFRSLPAMLVTLGVVGLSLMNGMGIAGWLGIQLNPTSLASGIILMTMSIAESVHLLTTFAHERGRGADKVAAMRESLTQNFTPIFLTSFTTVVGFLGMNTSDVPPNRDLGNIVAIGVTASWLLAISFLPAAMMVLPLGPARQREKTEHSLNRVAEWVLRWRRPLLWGNILLVLGLAACIPLSKFGDNYVEFFDDSIKFRRDAEFINKRLTGMQYIEFTLPCREEGCIYDPEYLRQVEQFSDWLREQPEARKVSSLIEIMKSLNRTMHGGAEEQYRLPESRGAAAQYLLFYEMSLPPGMDLTGTANMQRSSTRVSVTLDTITSEELIALDERAEVWMKANLPPDRIGLTSSISVLFAHISHRNFVSMISGTLWSFIVISICLLLVFRSWKLGLISLVPNLTPAIVGFGIWALTVGQVVMTLAVVFSQTLGIVVDDTIHTLTKYRQGRVVKGYSPEDSVRYAFRTVGPAVWITSLVIVLGFAVLLFSNFTLTSHLGAMTALIFLIAMLSDLLFLPPLLMAIDRRLNLVPAKDAAAD